MGCILACYTGTKLFPNRTKLDTTQNKKILAEPKSKLKSESTVDRTKTKSSGNVKSKLSLFEPQPGLKPKTVQISTKLKSRVEKFEKTKSHQKQAKIGDFFCCPVDVDEGLYRRSPW